MLARTFLRFCALEALRPAALLAANAGWPTLAGKFVYDSRFDPIDDLSADEARPVISIFTEEDNFNPISQHGPIFYSATVDLVFEISTIGKQRAADGSYVAGFAYTDAEIEAELDLIEEQIFWLLHFGASGKLFRKIAKLPLRDWQSLPDRSTEESHRLAKRSIRIKVPLRELCYDAAPLTAPVGLDRLPQPIREIATQLAAAGYSDNIASALALAAPVAPVPDRLETVGLSIDAHDAINAEGAEDIEASAQNLQT